MVVESGSPATAKAGASVGAPGEGTGTTKKEDASKTQRDGHQMPGLALDTSNGFRALLYLDGNLLPGFDNQYIRCVGQADSPGLRATIEIPSEAAVLLKLEINIGDLWYPISSICLAKKKMRMTAEILDTGDTATMRTMFTVPSNKPESKLAIATCSPSSFPLVIDENLNVKEPATTFIQPTGFQLVRLTAVLNVDGFLVGCPPPFWKQIHHQPASVQTIAKDIMTLFSSMNKDNKGGQVSLWITFPIFPGWKRDWRAFLSDEDQVKQPLADNEFQAHLLPVPGSEWVPNTNDTQEYGMHATGLPTAYLMFLNLARDTESRGGGSRCYEKAESEAGIAVEDAQAALNNLREKTPKGGYIAGQELKVNAMKTKSFLENVAGALLSFMGNYCISSVEDRSKHFIWPIRFQQWEDAVQAASELRIRDGEDDKVHLERIANWVRFQGVVTTRQQPRQEGEPYSGHRLSMPCGIHADVALFYVEVPKQPSWARGFKQPPMAIDIPSKLLPSNLQNFLANAFKQPDDVRMAHIHESIDSQPIEAAFPIRFTPIDVPDWWRSILQSW